MPIPEAQLNRALQLLRAKEDAVGLDVRHLLELRHLVEGNTIYFFEWRPKFGEPETWTDSMVAKFVYVQSKDRWKLYAQDRNMKWRPYQPKPDAANFQTLFREVLNDPYCIFWG